MVRNIHQRVIRSPLELSRPAELIDSLGARENALWPRESWPPMRFNRPLGVGAIGGHGPVRYVVEAYEPGKSIRFRFTAPRGFVGTHGFDVEEIGPEAVRLRHTLLMRLRGWARLTWPLAFRWLHDALLEDALDCAEVNCGASRREKRKWSVWVRVLRRGASYLS